MTNTDSIRKEMLLLAPRARVWRALSDAGEFATWFKMKLDGPFEVGRTVHGRFEIPKYEHLSFEMKVERIDPQDVFSYRWHPYAMDPDVDYSKEPMTLVQFELVDAPDGTLLTLTESGFDKIPASHREEAFRMNEGGWGSKVVDLKRYVEA